MVDFLKSNSMSKDCQVYYINSRIEGKKGNNLYEELKKRVFFDFDQQGTVLSKLYAYSGTLCSDCTLLDDIKLKDEEIVVVDDKRDIKYADCVTMISTDLIFSKIKKIMGYIDDEPKIAINALEGRISFKELESIYDSLELDGNNITKDIKDLLNEFKMLDRTSTRIFKKNLGELIDKYDYIGNDSNEVIWERMIVKNYPFDLLLFDGEGFISQEFCNEIRASLRNKLGNDNYKVSTSFQIRMPYVKGMVHAVDIRGFFREKGLSEIQHIKFSSGKKYDVSKIKLILTNSQFKLESFIKCGKCQ